MASKREKLRLTIDVMGKAYKLLSFAIRNNGDLGIDLKPATHEYQAPELERPRAEIVSARLSIHQTSRDPTGNTFTFEVQRTPQSGAALRSQNFTRAMKTFDRFAPVLFRRFPLLVDHGQPDDGKCPTFSLGEMDEKSFSLIVAMFVCRSTRTFDCPEDDFKVAQRKFGDFNLVFLVSFLSLPALPTGTTLFRINQRRFESSSPS